MVFTGLVAAVGLALLLGSAYDGWLGPDVGRGDQFCEAARAGWIKQPANTWSNLGFIAAGLAVAAHLVHSGVRGGPLGRHRPLASAYALLVVLLGPASMAMHATQTDLGGRIDMASMYLVASFVAGYAAMRLAGRGPAFLGVVFVAFTTGSELIGTWSREIPVVAHAGNLAFGVLLVTGLAGEVLLLRRGLVVDRRWAAAAVACLAIAFTIWNTTATGSPLCSPHSLLQGHAVWHLLCAAAAYCMYRYYASERD